LDPAYPAERLNFMLEDAAVRLVVTQEKLGSLLDATTAELLCIDSNCDEITREDDKNVESGVESENLAYVIYTSGSTGRPKGTMITHRSVVNLVTDAVRKFRLKPESKFLQFASLSFDVAVEEIYPVWFIGGAVVLRSDEVLYSYAELSKTIERHEVTTVELPTVYWSEWIGEMSRTQSKAPRSLDLVLTGDERVSPEILKEWKEQEVSLLHVYGVTEVAVTSIVYPVPADLGDRGNCAAIPIGLPMANTEVYLLDGVLQPTPLRMTSELYLGGEGVSRGYLNRPELTAERFVPSPFGKRPGSRLYKSGDLARSTREGYLEFVGRVDHQVKIRGYRVEPGEIEAVLNEHQSVRRSIIVAIDDERGGNRLVGYVVGEDGVTVAELKSHLRERLPEHMVPQEMLLLEEMPVIVNGKIDRKRLLSLTDARQPRIERFVSPRDLLEFRLVQIWESVLHIHPISVKDNFFDLGGHSLLAVSLMSKIRSVVGRELPLSSLFQGGTVEHMAAILRRDAGLISWSCLVEFQAAGSRHPLFLIHPSGGNVLCYSHLARRLGSDQPVYGIQTPGLYRERPLYTRIEDMAAYYIEVIRTIQTEGPYSIGGWSLGGVVAFEMAQQLTAQQQKVEHLLMLDSGPWRAEEKSIDDEDAAEILLEALKDYEPVLMKEIEPLQGDERIDYLLKKAISMDFLPPDFEVAQAHHLLTVEKTNERAMEQYVPQLYPGRVTVFKAVPPIAVQLSGVSTGSGEAREVLPDSTMGWEELAAGGVQVIDVPGTHGTMLTPPYVETVALRIRACLDDARTAAMDLPHETPCL
jgi:amino acid adenylation domain-containing protein